MPELTYNGLTTFEASYLETALWSSTDGDGTPLDDSKYTDAEPTAETVARIRLDCAKFIEQAEPIFLSADLSIYGSANRVAHDFWLTRNHHGAGFWDGDYPEPLSKQLTDLAHSFEEVNPYIENEKIYIE